MSLLELLRQYSLREYAAVTAFAMLGAIGLVFMLSSASGGTASSESVLLKRQTAQSAPHTSARYVEAELSVQERRAARLERQRKIRVARNARAVHRAAVAAAARARSAPTTTKTTTVPSTPQLTPPETTRVLNTTPAPRPVQKPAPAPAPKPTPKKSGTTGGGGGSFDDSG